MKREEEELKTESVIRDFGQTERLINIKIQDKLEILWVHLLKK